MSRFTEDGFREASVRTSDDAKRRAFGHVFGSINSAVSFPSQVFLGSWGAFLFFESDRLFSPGFAVIAAGLLNAEGAEVCCLLNLSETDRMVYEEAAMLFIDAGMEPHSYDAALRQGGPANGWLFGMELLAFYDFPAEHWVHLRTSNVIESTFATIRHRTDRVKGAFSRTSLLSMLFKLALCAEKSFRRLKGFNWLAEVVRGVKFADGVKQEDQQLAAA
jgi:hypothetical protein